jgi:hypothetical protein
MAAARLRFDHEQGCWFEEMCGAGAVGRRYRAALLPLRSGWVPHTEINWPQICADAGYGQQPRTFSTLRDANDNLGEGDRAQFPRGVLAPFVA